MTAVALLRAINVGGRTVRMEQLRALFGELGFAAVRTVVASGNVIFDGPRPTAALERRIEAHLKASLGYDVATFLRTPEELATVAGYAAYPARALAAPGARLFVGFLKDAPDRSAAKRALALASPTDELVVRGREVYWLCKVPSNESSLSGNVIEKALGQPVTVRNVTTVRKLGPVPASRPAARRG